MKRILISIFALGMFSLSASAATLHFEGAGQIRPNLKHGLRAFVIEEPADLADPQAGTTHSVTLTWVAPVIPTGSVCVLGGYNLKRSLSSGTEATLSSPTATTFLDTAVTGGQKYFYVVTATYGTTCTESGPSNEVSAQIPLDQGPSPTGLAASGIK